MRTSHRWTQTLGQAMAFLGMLTAARVGRAEEAQERPILPELAQYVVLKVNGVPLSQEMLASQEEWDVRGHLELVRTNLLHPRDRMVIYCHYARLSKRESSWSFS